MGLECILEQIISNIEADHALFRKVFNSGVVTHVIKVLYQGHKKGVQKKSLDTQILISEDDFLFRDVTIKHIQQKKFMG